MQAPAQLDKARLHADLMDSDPLDQAPLDQGPRDPAMGGAQRAGANGTGARGRIGGIAANRAETPRAKTLRPLPPASGAGTRPRASTSTRAWGQGAWGWEP